MPVIGQHLLAGFGEPAAILFQARQHDLIAFLDVRPAKPRDIACAGIMSLLLGRSRRRDQNQRNDEKKLGHRTMPHTGNERVGAF